jgi:hypothetical protein
MNPPAPEHQFQVRSNESTVHVFGDNGIAAARFQPFLDATGGERKLQRRMLFTRIVHGIKHGQRVPAPSVEQQPQVTLGVRVIAPALGSAPVFEHVNALLNVDKQKRRSGVKFIDHSRRPLVGCGSILSRRIFPAQLEQMILLRGG